MVLIGKRKRQLGSEIKKVTKYKEKMKSEMQKNLRRRIKHFRKEVNLQNACKENSNKMNNSKNS